MGEDELSKDEAFSVDVLRWMSNMNVFENTTVSVCPLCVLRVL